MDPGTALKLYGAAFAAWMVLVVRPNATRAFFVLSLAGTLAYIAYFNTRISRDSGVLTGERQNEASYTANWATTMRPIPLRLREARISPALVQANDIVQGLRARDEGCANTVIMITEEFMTRYRRLMMAPVPRASDDGEDLFREFGTLSGLRAELLNTLETMRYKATDSQQPDVQRAIELVIGATYRYLKIAHNRLRSFDGQGGRRRPDMDAYHTVPRPQDPAFDPNFDLYA